MAETTIAEASAPVEDRRYRAPLIQGVTLFVDGETPVEVIGLTHGYACLKVGGQVTVHGDNDTPGPAADLDTLQEFADSIDAAILKARWELAGMAECPECGGHGEMSGRDPQQTAPCRRCAASGEVRA